MIRSLRLKTLIDPQGNKVSAIPICYLRGKDERISSIYWRLLYGKTLTPYEIEKRKWNIPLETHMGIQLEVYYEGPIFDMLHEKTPLLSKIPKESSWTGGRVTIPLKMRS